MPATVAQTRAEGTPSVLAERMGRTYAIHARAVAQSQGRAAPSPVKGTVTTRKANASGPGRRGSDAGRRWWCRAAIRGCPPGLAPPKGDWTYSRPKEHRQNTNQTTDRTAPGGRWTRASRSNQRHARTTAEARMTKT